MQSRFGGGRAASARGLNPDANEARDRSRAPLSLALTRDRLAIAFRAVGGGSPFDTTGDCSPAIWAARPSAEAWGLGYPSLSFRRSRRTGNHRSPALAGVDRSPGGGAEAPQVPEGRSGQPPDGAELSPRFGTPAEAFVPSSASASAGGCPAGFSPPRVTPFPSSPKTFRRGVAASARAASGVRIPSTFQ